MQKQAGHGKRKSGRRHFEFGQVNESRAATYVSMAMDGATRGPRVPEGAKAEAAPRRRAITRPRIVTVEWERKRGAAQDRAALKVKWGRMEETYYFFRFWQLAI